MNQQLVRRIALCWTTRTLAILLALATSAIDAQGPAVRRLRLVEEQRLDAAREDFSVVSGGRVNTRGDMAVTLRADYQVRIYDSSGRRMATVGRRGEGPAEFQLPQVQGWIADTVWIYDVRLRRHSFFVRSGAFLRNVALETAQREVRVTNEPDGARLLDFLPHARRADGGMVGVGTLVRDLRGSSRQSRERILARWLPNGTANRIVSAEFDTRWEPALGATSAILVARDGEEAIVVSVSDLTREGSHVLLRRVSMTGVTTAETRIPFRGIPYPKARRDSMLRRGVGPDHEQRIPASRVPLFLSPIVGLVAREDGMALLTLLEAATSQQVLLIDRAGAIRGSFGLPVNAEVMMAYRTKVWLRERDQDDLTSVVRYRLQ